MSGIDKRPNRSCVQNTRLSQSHHRITRRNCLQVSSSPSSDANLVNVCIAGSPIGAAAAAAAAAAEVELRQWSTRLSAKRVLSSSSAVTFCRFSWFSGQQYINDDVVDASRVWINPVLLRISHETSHGSLVGRFILDT